MSFSTTGSLSSVPNGRIVDFDIAELRKLPFQDSLYLWVRGKLPGIYQERPDYWGIEVAIVHVPGATNHDAQNSGDLIFERSVPLTGIVGVKGITVIGANQVKRIDIAGES